MKRIESKYDLVETLVILQRATDHARQSGSIGKDAAQQMARVFRYVATTHYCDDCKGEVGQ